MKNICVPTNFSEMADQALITSINLANKIKGHITLVHLIEGNHFAIIKNDDVIESIRVNEPKIINQVIEAQNKLKLYHDKYKENNISTEIIIAEENQSMADIMEIIKADLVISGTTLINGYGEDLLIGENTRLLIKKCKAPVITLKETLKELSISKVVFATNFKEGHFELIKSLAYFIEGFSAKLFVLYVATPDSFATTRKLTKVFEAMKLKYDLKNIELSVYNATSKGEGVLQFTEDNNIDLIIMPTQGRTGVDYFFNSSIAEQVLDEANVPVMTILNK